MKVCVFGAGAIGGYLAAKLSATGTAEVSCVARGRTSPRCGPTASRSEAKGRRWSRTPAAPTTPAELGPQDFVVIAVKAHSLPAAAPSIQHLFGERTTLVRRSTAFPGGTSTSRAGPGRTRGWRAWIPGGKLWDLLPPRRVVGCIVYPATEVVAPGVIEHTYSNRFDLGEPDGRRASGSSRSRS